MKRISKAVFPVFLCFLLLFGMGVFAAAEEDSQVYAKLLYMGHASIRITTAEGKVIQLVKD